METEIAYVSVSNPQRFANTRRISEDDGQADDRSYVQPKSRIRIQIILLLASCLFCSDLLRLNLSLALPFMLNATDSRTHWTTTNGTCPIWPSSTDRIDPSSTIKRVVVEKLEYTPLQQSFLIGSYHSGAAILGFPAYFVSKKKAPRQLLMSAIALTSLLSIFVPTAAFFGYVFAFGARVIQGAARAFVLPNVLRIARAWIPVEERPEAFLLCLIGFSLSHILGAPLIVILSTIRATFGGWPVTFYISATLGFMWMAVWVLVSTSEPERHLRISRYEKGRILDSFEEQLLDNQFHKSSFAQGFKALFKSRSCLAYYSTSFVFFAGLSFWENYALIYAKLVANFRIPDQLLWIYDFFPFMTFSLIAILVFYLKRRYENPDGAQQDEGGIRWLRWLTSAGTSAVLLILVPLFFFTCDRPYWPLVTLCLGCGLAALYFQGQSSLYFQYLHIDNVRMHLISAAIFGEFGSAVSAFGVGVLWKFVREKTWLVTCVILTVLALISVLGILITGRNSRADTNRREASPSPTSS